MIMMALTLQNRGSLLAHDVHNPLGSLMVSRVKTDSNGVWGTACPEILQGGQGKQAHKAPGQVTVRTSESAKLRGREHGDF